MPFCPLCKTEYKPEATMCADCNVHLVEELPKEPDTSHIEFHRENWLEIARLTAKSYAEMVLEVWQQNDIRGLVQSKAGFFGMTGQMGASAFQAAGGAYSLWVHKDDVVKADELAAGILGETWDSAKLIDIENTED